MPRPVTLLLLSPALILALPTRAATISGAVLGPDGKPIAGARVVQIVYSRSGKESPSATSDAAGVWKIEVPDPKPRPGAKDVKDVKDEGMPFAQVLVHARGFALAQDVVGGKPGSIKLARGTSASGIVLDGAGKPVANVPVQLESVTNRSRSLNDFSLSQHFRLEEPMGAVFTARSGEDGRWTLSDLPTVGEARFEVRDAKYAVSRATAKLSAQASEAGKITVRAAAILMGRVVDESGKPVAGASVLGSMYQGGGSSWGEGKTGADGTYRLGSLSAGVHEVKAHDGWGENRKVDWVAAPISDALAVAGREVKLRDIVAGEGALVTGKVFDAGTGAVLLDVGVTDSKSENWSRSDEKGLYRLRVLPGKASIYIGGKPAGYLHPAIGNPSSTMSITLKKGEVRTINWKLPRALEASGVVLGEDGKAVAEVSLRLRSSDDSRSDDGESVHSDEKGAWKTYQGLKPGRYTLAGDDNWEVVSPKDISVPQRGALQVRVRRLTSQALDVRAVTPDGKPISGVALKFSINVPQGGGISHGNSDEGETDAAGKFSLGKLRPDYRVSLQATRAGYKYLRGGKAEYKDGAWTAEDVVMTPLLGHAVGRVVDAKGQPVAGAKVFSPEAAGSQAASDAEGQFTLEALPEGEITLVATGASGVVARAARAGEAGLSLALRPQQRIVTPDRDTAYAILEDVWETSRGSDWSRRAVLPAEYGADDLDQALKLALSSGADRETGASLGVQTLVARLIEDDPALAIEWAPAYLSHIQGPYQRLKATVALGLAASKIKPDVAAQLYAQAKKIKAEVVVADNEVLATAQLAALASRLGNGEAEALADRALLAVKGSSERTLEVAQALALGSAEGASRAVEQLPAPKGEDWAQAWGWAWAIETLTGHDPKGALALLDKLDKWESPQSEAAFGRAALVVIPALGPGDPAAALALARRVREGDKPHALALAARFQPKAEALALLREAARAIPASYWIVASTLGLIAAQAHNLDAQAGAELFALAREKMQALMEEGSWRQQEGAREVAVFAFYLSRAHPNESRVLLEQEWAFQKALPLEARHFSRLDDLAVAMAALDPARAREMAWQAGGFQGLSGQFEAQMRIARLLMKPRADEGSLFSKR